MINLGNDYETIPAVQESAGNSDNDITNDDLDKLPSYDFRGIDIETYRHYGCSYDEKQRRIVIPTILPDGNKSYSAVLTNSKRQELKDEGTAEKDIKKVLAGGGTRGIFNLDKIVPDQPVVVVEGEIDALSIIQAGYQNVIAVGGQSVGNLCSWLNNNPAEYQFVVLFDNDKAGVKAAPKAIDALLRAGYRAVSDIISHDALKVDCNDILTAQGSAELHSRINTITASAQFKFPDVKFPPPAKKSAKTQKKKDYPPLPVDEIKRMLEKIPVESLSYDEWALTVGGGLVDWGKSINDTETAFQLFNEFSARDTRPNQYSENECMSQWNSLVKGVDKENKRNIGSLIELAKQYSYKLPADKSVMDVSATLDTKEKLPTLEISAELVKKFSDYLIDTYDYRQNNLRGIDILFFGAKVMKGVTYSEFFKAVQQRREMSLSNATEFLKTINTAKCVTYTADDFFNEEDKAKAIRACVQCFKEKLESEIPKISQELKPFFDTPNSDTSTPAQGKLDNLDGRFKVRYEFFNGEFQREQNLFSEYAERKTGFTTLDEVQIFAPGLYVLGGLPSIGKSTFAWQMADYLASAGEEVIYISYEMSAMELYSKTISREVYLDTNGRVQCPAVNIRRKLYGNNHEVEQKIESFASQFGGAAIFKVGSESSAEILNLILNQCKKIDDDNAMRGLNTKKPIFFIDYLQLVAVGSREVKNAIDEFVRYLKIFQQKTNATIICLSSFNRDNYLNTVGFESFKESGGIEYTADVVIGLQYDCIKNFSPSETLTDRREKLQKARQMSPREINLVCLKNRFGSVYDLNFRYYPAVDLFVCEDDTTVGAPPKRKAR